MATFENRRAAAIWAVSTGSAESGRSEPGMGQIRMHRGALAQLGEHLLCKQGVIGSIPIGSTKLCFQGAKMLRITPWRRSSAARA